jgi:DNA-binding SARP family transcriptional activator
LKLYLLGSFRVVVRGEDRTGRIRPKSRALLKALAANRSGVLTKDALAETLWPGADPSSSHLSLKVEAHNLRRALGCVAGDEMAWIQNEQGAYRLNRSNLIWLDVEAFESHVRRAREFDAVGDRASAAAEYEAALDAYGGDYLEEDMYDDSTIVTRERLRDLQLNVLSRLARLAWKARDHETTISYCHRIVTADPCREDAYQLLILSHAALRQVSRATAWYEVARQSLRRELDRDVGRKTREIYESLFSRQV